MKFSYKLYSSHLDDGEKILNVARRHIFIFISDAFKAIFFGLVIPIGLFILVPEFFNFCLIWMGVGLLFVFYHFIDWYFDAWLITNVGIIDIERHGLFERNSTRCDYHLIEGVSYTIKGVIPTLFAYGDIMLDKLGAQTQVILKDAAFPKNVERLLIRYQEKYVKERSVRDHVALKDMLSEMIAYHVQNEKISSKLE